MKLGEDRPEDEMQTIHEWVSEGKEKIINTISAFCKAEGKNQIVIIYPLFWNRTMFMVLLPACMQLCIISPEFLYAIFT